MFITLTLIDGNQSSIVDDDGQAKKELMMKDGLHPNEEGLKEILNYIRTHAYIPKKK